MVKIFGWQADEQGCGTYRVALPLDALAARGHEATYGTRMPDWVREGEADVVVAQRTCEPGPSGIWKRLATQGKSRLVFEVDDDLWSVDLSNRPAHAFYTEDRKRRLIENIRVADAVTVTTEPLAEVVSQWNRNVHIVPNCVPGWLLDHERPQTDLVTIGWRGGRSHDRDFGELARPLRQFLQHPSFRNRVELHCMGAQYHERVATRHGRTRWTGWHEGVADFLKAVDFDVAVIPLRPSRFNNSKSDLAVVEMSALGIPVIASDTGPYERTDAPILRVSSPRQWAEELESLATDEGYRDVLGKEAREWAAGRTIEGNAWRWEEAYR